MIEGGRLLIIPVILSGGAGSRLWPLSRMHHPKPFIALPDGGTLIARTYARALGLPGADHVVTITNRELLFDTSDEYETVDGGRTRNTYLLEPVGRDTAPAIALGTLRIAQTEGENAVMVTMPADHLIDDGEAFARTIASAVQLAVQGGIVTLGVKPTRPETGYGYIEAENDKVIGFVEKPDAETARRYMASGRHLWNSGIFCFTAGTMIRAMERHCPDVLQAAGAALDAARTTDGDKRSLIAIDAEQFAAAPSISIDYAVMEKADNINVVPAAFDWSDIGSWEAFAALTPADDEGNRTIGETSLHQSSRCYVNGADRLVALVGVKDLFVVDTADALLVAGQDSVQEVRKIYDRLKSDGHQAAVEHRTVHRPWGTYCVLETGPGFKIKRIEVKAGGRLSLQSHRRRSEHWVVVSGHARVTNGDEVLLLENNQSTYVPAEQKHRLENPGQEPLVMIEVQCGDYLGEDDIERFDDIYGRS